MEWQMSEREVRGVTIVRLSGRVTFERSDELEETLTRLVEAGRAKILLECSEVRAIDSRGIGVVARGLNRAVRAGGALKLLDPSPRVREALALVGLQQVMESFTDEAAALASFASAPK